jgi:putative heme iron utilization protein
LERALQEKRKEVLRPTDGEAVRLAKTLLRGACYGALATLDPASGAPVATRVAVATDTDGAPIVLVSSLSAHTGGLLGDPRCSLLIGEPGKGDPLAHPRMTIACHAVKLERGTPAHAQAERRYLNRQPKAKLYAGFADFSFFRLEPQNASLNGGFGKAYALAAADLITASPANGALASSEQSAVSHMNSDHRDAIAVYARAYANAPDGDWIMTGIDAEGIDIACGDDSRRIFFPEPLQSPSDMRSALVRMAAEGRKLLGAATAHN